MNDHNQTNAELIAELVKLRQDNQRCDQIQNLIEGMPVGFALCEIILDKQGKPIDYRYIWWKNVPKKYLVVLKAIG